MPADVADDAPSPAGERGRRARANTVSGAVRAPFAVLGSWRTRALDDPRHDERTAAILGIALGVCFTVCFLTGLFSHLQQHPVDWLVIPSQPAGLFRVTQGLHVATGIATVPLLLAKLWAVFPRFFRWPPVTGVAHALERLSLVPLVAGALFLLFSGIVNIDLWYFLPFNFPAAHYWVAWLTIGALVVHVGAKLTVTREALRRVATTTGVEPTRDPTRRRFLGFVGASAAGLTAVTIGQTVNPLQGLDLLGPRRPDTGTSGFPVNGSARETGVIDEATSPDYRLQVVGNVSRPLTLSLADLQALPQREAVLPIACVEGWSASRRWRGISLPDLLDRAGAGPDATVTVRSIQKDGFNSGDINHTQAHDPDTLLALEADGQPLALDHGFPVRPDEPHRPGVLQTKWVAIVEVH
jgi:hypothetical protein